MMKFGLAQVSFELNFIIKIRHRALVKLYIIKTLYKALGEFL